jgi:hypothetical protein
MLGGVLALNPAAGAEAARANTVAGKDMVAAPGQGESGVAAGGGW